MRLLGNEIGTTQWTELDQVAITEMVNQSTDDPAVRQQVSDWLRDAAHGDVMVLGSLRIVAVHVDDDDDAGQPVTE